MEETSTDQLESAALDEAPAPNLAPSAAPPDAPEMETDIRTIVRDGFERVQSALEERLALDRFRENQIDKLHAEVQGYKADVVSKAVRPVLQSLIRLHDDLGKVIDALRAEDEAALSPQRLLTLLEGFHEDVELALDHNGVSVFRTTTDEFDPRRQKAVRTVDAEEPAHAGRVAARVRPGFEQGDVIVEKERVAVYVLSERPTDAEVKE
jgi:molecular chaperone GrpE